MPAILLMLLLTSLLPDEWQPLFRSEVQLAAVDVQVLSKAGLSLG